MQCSWKAVLLLALTSIAIQYTAIRTFTARSFRLCTIPNPLNCSAVLDVELPDRVCDEIPVVSNVSRRTHILILATTRSGSTFVGQLLNQHFDIFYLFEPLYHVQYALLSKETQGKGSSDNIHNKRMVLSNSDRRMMLGASRDLLRSLYDCDLYFLENYIKPQPVNHTTDRLFRRGASKALCSLPVCEALGPVDIHPEEEDCIKKCGTLNLTLAMESCKDHEHVAIKTVRVPEVSDLRALVEDPRLNLKIIQLVRDPRGILASRSDTFQDTYRLWRIWRATGRKPYNLDTSQFLTVCEDFLSSVSTGLNRPSWLKGKYILLRYEDMARNPMKKAEEIYNFLGIPMDSSIERWIENNTRADNTSVKHKYGTLRNSAATAENWRLTLSYDIVEFIQNTCQEVLAQLGYKTVNSAQDLKNLSFSLVEERTFSPFF
ncbi:carbohydrate sulfotransferase 1 [Microcaecilia unicolor]|uniref:Sulfotransferase n=1 Tax=Microcaecilia unicolor TaxID=1415580 RepID=A0A6P7XY18_9AMPH|nr:carbohydrate sulfotransferase 1 [Microcaecilia unicolor]XP_030055343.1 carbohydrate sulfotransferase 1 [Microcaecilia unicolor]XP_030055344.1 carbohydrate sulfotransferase 1 [Microcaecilia unicolor]XP_030055345.1 carbohydrate sulfotransferase 1 [Microcaecilia unicolor]